LRLGKSKEGVRKNMRETIPVEYPGMDSILENIDYYINKFKNDSIIVFRNANLSPDEQEELTRKMGDHFGWFPNSTSGSLERYTENHDKNDFLSRADGDTIFLDWHVEHPYYELPIAASTWNMLNLKADPNTGKTYFVDMAKMYRSLPEDWQKFLDRITVNGFNPAIHTEQKESKTVWQHWLINEKVIRFQIDKHYSKEHLKTFDGRTPTIEEQEKLVEIATHIYSELNRDGDHRIVHKWQNGDLVIPDMFKLAHAVTGGFSPSDRKFTGLWVYAENNEGSIK
jgi:alpha-ketoglutarate-dependent taurine dioxygenase